MSWIRIDPSQLTEHIDRLRSAGPFLRHDVQQYLSRDGGRLIQRYAVQNVSGVPFEAAQTTDPPTIFKRTGNLSRAIEVESPWHGIPMSLRVYADARTRTGANYANVLHDGGTIYPRNPRGVLVFRIPIQNARYGGKKAAYGMRRIRRWARAHAYRAGLDDTNSVLVFAKKVTIPRRPFLRDAVDQALPEIVANLRTIIARHFEGEPT